jgi:prephenate dehydratase
MIKDKRQEETRFMVINSNESPTMTIKYGSTVYNLPEAKIRSHPSKYKIHT